MSDSILQGDTYVLIKKQILIDIANAIRTASNTIDRYSPSEMADIILNLSAIASIDLVDNVLTIR